MMKCPKCGEFKLYANNTRDEGSYIQRYRRCSNCGARVRTLELYEMENKGKDGRELLKVWR